MCLILKSEKQGEREGDNMAKKIQDLSFGELLLSTFWLIEILACIVGYLIVDILLLPSGWAEYFAFVAAQAFVVSANIVLWIVVFGRWSSLDIFGGVNGKKRHRTKK
jgi:hypothetical protein